MENREYYSCNNLSQVLVDLQSFNKKMADIFENLQSFNENMAQTYANLPSHNENIVQTFANLQSFNEKMTQTFANLPLFNEKMSQVLANQPLYNEKIAQVCANLQSLHEYKSDISFDATILDEETVSAINNIEIEINNALLEKNHLINFDTIEEYGEPSYDFDLNNISEANSDILSRILDIIVNLSQENNEILDMKINEFSERQSREALIIFFSQIFISFFIYALCTVQ